jgi:hypothetical protein
MLEDFFSEEKVCIRNSNALLIIVLGLTYIYINKAYKNSLTYINAIDNVYNCNINRMAVDLLKTNNLYGRNAELIFMRLGIKRITFLQIVKKELHFRRQNNCF